jgi:Glycosyl hydrolase family 79 C-terminal beta domain
LQEPYFSLILLSSQIQPITLDRSITDGTPFPSPLPPHIQPQYYAAIIAAEAIGDSGDTRAVELSIADDSISGYAFYEHGKLARALIINSRAFFSAASAPRTSVHINLAFSGDVPITMTVKRLSIPLVSFFFRAYGPFL